MAYINGIEIVAPVIQKNAPSIVVPAEGSESIVATFKESIPGLVKLYNESSGLRLDGKQRLCIAAASEYDIDQGVSVNKPIVPATLKKAMSSKTVKAGDFRNIGTDSEVQGTAMLPPASIVVKNYIDSTKSYSGDFSDVDAYEPAYDLKFPTVTAIKKYVDKSLKNFEVPSPLKFRLARVPKNGTFEIKPGMIAIILPWKKSYFYTPDNTAIIEGAGTSIVFATDRMNGDDVIMDNGTNYWVSILSISGITSTSKHDVYSLSSGKHCYFKNTHDDTSGSGAAYVYYLG